MNDLLEGERGRRQGPGGCSQGRREAVWIRAVKDVPDDATLAQARASLLDEAGKVQAALSDLGTAASC